MSAAVAPPSTQSAPAHEPLGFRVLTSYGSIQLGINLVSTMCLVHMLFFYTDVIHVRPELAGTVILLGNIWDGITDPLMGMWSDARRGPKGRRRPFFIPGAISMALFYFLLFSPPQFLSGNQPFLWMLFTYLAFCTGRTVLDVPYQALMPDLTQHYDERTRLAGWRTGLSIFGDICGGLTPILLLIALGNQREAFTISCAGMATLAVTCGLYGKWGTYERARSEDRDATTPAIARTPRQLLRAIVEPIASPPAICLVIAYMLVVVGTGFPYTTFRYVSKYYFQNPDFDLKIMMCYQFTGLLAAPLWIWLTSRISKKYAFQAAILGYVFATLPVLFCDYEDTTLFLCAMAACGFFGTGVWMVPTAIAPDVLDWHRVHRSRAREGAFYGLWSFISKLAFGIAPWLVGLTLARVGWQPDVVQDGRVLQAILAMFVVYPLGLMGMGALVFVAYPISKEIHHALQAELSARSQEHTP